jgi:hypothetical protein
VLLSDQLHLASGDQLHDMQQALRILVSLESPHLCTVAAHLHALPSWHAQVLPY